MSDTWIAYSQGILTGVILFGAGAGLTAFALDKVGLGAVVTFILMAASIAKWCLPPAF